MRIGALPGLRIGDLSTMTQRKDIYKIQVYARTKDSHYTFCTPECKNAIDEYLYSFREVYGEAIQKDSPLIRETFDMTARYAAAKPLPMKESELETLMYRILKRSIKIFATVYYVCLYDTGLNKSNRHTYNNILDNLESFYRNYSMY